MVTIELHNHSGEEVGVGEIGLCSGSTEIITNLIDYGLAVTLSDNPEIVTDASKDRFTKTLARVLGPVRS